MLYPAIYEAIPGNPVILNNPATNIDENACLIGLAFFRACGYINLKNKKETKKLIGVHEV